MEVLECIKKRRSVRDYVVDKEIPWDFIVNIIDAARFAPSAGNLQNWKFIVILDEGKRQALAEACLNQQWMTTAPVYIVIASEPDKAEHYYKERGKHLYTTQNCAMAAENMLLEATNLGLGSCFVSAFVREQVKRIMGMPEEIEPQGVITIGYAKTVPEQPMKWPIENVLYFNGWRSKLKDPHLYFKWYSVELHKQLGSGKKAVVKAGKTIGEKAKELIDKVHQKLKEKKQ